MNTLVKPPCCNGGPEGLVSITESSILTTAEKYKYFAIVQTDMYNEIENFEGLRDIKVPTNDANARLSCKLLANTIANCGFEDDAEAYVYTYKLKETEVNLNYLNTIRKIANNKDKWTEFVLYVLQLLALTDAEFVTCYVVHSYQYYNSTEDRENGTDPDWHDFEDIINDYNEEPELSYTLSNLPSAYHFDKTLHPNIDSIMTNCMHKFIRKL